MKVAVVYNRESQNVINLFGQANKEKIGLKTIRRITDALKQNKHQVKAFEGDKNLIPNLEEFMPRVLKGERPGMVFNVSYGIQGEARYTHVPGILEMVGIPYLASGPLAHSLALDKVVSKTIFQQLGIPTANFEVLLDKNFKPPTLPYPLIVKPKNEAVSFGIQVVYNEEELARAAAVIFKAFNQPVLAEQYIEGREINVGILGNDPIEAFPPAEIIFDNQGPSIYTHEDKMGISGRKINVKCPAGLSKEKTMEVQEIARKTFRALGCRDCARVDLRMDNRGNFYVLELNSLPSLGEHGSFTHAALTAGLDYPKLVNRLVEVASTRYFGTPSPPTIYLKKQDKNDQIFTFITGRRDHMEKRLRDWTAISSHTGDPVGLELACKEFTRIMEQIKLKPRKDYSDSRSVYTWETREGLDDGILIIGNLDVPYQSGTPAPSFRRTADQLYGEGIGCSRAPLVQVETALSALRSIRRLHHTRLGVLFYQDEGRDCRYSGETIGQICSRVREVLVVRPGGVGANIYTQHRGQVKLNLVIEGQPRRLGQAGTRLDVNRWTMKKLEQICALSSRPDRLALGVVNLEVNHYPLRLPHRTKAELLLSYYDKNKIDNVLIEVKKILGRKGYKWNLELIADRPPMVERRNSIQMFKRFKELAEKWEIPLDKTSSLWPSVGGLVPRKTGVLGGLAPVSQDLYTPDESISRISLLRRTLLLAFYLVSRSGSPDSSS
jgi:D-alanine-D-alanine ligase